MQALHNLSTWCFRFSFFLRAERVACCPLATYSTQEYITATPSVLPHKYFHHLGLSDPVTLTITTKEEVKPPICSFSHHSTQCRSLIGPGLCTPNSNCQPLARSTSWFDFAGSIAAPYKTWQITNLLFAALQLKAWKNSRHTSRKEDGRVGGGRRGRCLARSAHYAPLARSLSQHGRACIAH